MIKMVCMHERVPEVPFLRLPKKGKPHSALLFQYSRKFGFNGLGENTKPHTRGGATTVSLVDADEQWIITGRTICSMSDNFSYREGRDRALLRVTNLGLGHSDLDSGWMYRFDPKYFDAVALLALVAEARNKLKLEPNTAYINPNDAEIMPEIHGFTVKTSKIILKNHVWVGFEE